MEQMMEVDHSNHMDDNIEEQDRKATELWDDDLMFGDANDNSRSPRASSRASSIHESEAPPPPPGGGNGDSDDCKTPIYGKAIVDYEDDFDRADREERERTEQDNALNSEKGEMSPQSSRHTSPGSVIPEPKPPGRMTQEDSPSDDERIDQIIAEGEKTVKESKERFVGDVSGTSTPASNSPSRYPSPSEQDLDYIEGPDRLDEPVMIPSDSEGDVDSKLMATFVTYFEHKARGIDMNDQIQNKKFYKNPSSYEDIIKRFGIDEKGTNFNPRLFNPHGFLEDCYYDQLHIQQAKLMDREHKHKAKSSK